MYKATYTNEELDKQIEFNNKKCGHCMTHACKGFGCKVLNHTAKVGERTPDITPELKKKYFEFVGA